MTYEEFISKYHFALNGQQAEAVRTVDGPVLLLAVPGSGKTTVLVTRLGYMIFCRGIAPEQILTVTYTVAATGDMKRRFEQLFGSEQSGKLTFRTINGICNQILLMYGRMTGKKVFPLADESEIISILTAAFRKIEEEYPTDGDLEEIRREITRIKNMMMTEDEIRKNEKRSSFALGALYREYTEEMRMRRLIDYDDQMVYAYRILTGRTDVLDRFRKRFRYVCVDEAQDTSKIQHAIIKLLAGGTGNLFMVGDEDQSIYGFRAAYPDALLSFEQDYPGARILLMEENFRSGGSIVDLADSFIRKNMLRRDKHMFTARDRGVPVNVIAMKSRKAQYTWLLKMAAECRKETAVLYRDNESVIPLVDMLDRQGIPYRIRNADLSFFTCRVVRDLAFMERLSEDPFDTEAFLQLYYKLGTYIGRDAAREAARISRRHRIPVLDAALSYADVSYPTKRSASAIRTHLKHMVNDTAKAALLRIEEYMQYGEYLDRSGQGRGKLFLLKLIAEKEPSLKRLLERLGELRELIRSGENESSCPLVLSTIHGSKGLEYDSVYMLDVADGIFPETVPVLTMKNGKPGKDWELYEEERRLFYVGITRAKNQLTLFDVQNQSSFCRELLENKYKGM